MAETPQEQQVVPEGLAVVRVVSSRAQEDRWLLALVALGIPHQVVQHPHEFHRLLVVRQQDVERAVRTLDDVEAETAERAQEARQPPPEKMPWWAWGSMQVMVLSLMVFFMVVGGRGDHSPWMDAGVMDSDLVLHGAYQRLLTGVTLHADAAHLLGNALFLAVVSPTVVQRTGPGVTALTLLATGVMGNVITSAIHNVDFSNVGASGGVFGLMAVLGIVAARTRSSRAGRNRWVVGTGAALGLLCMLGFGEHSDVAAHMAGFAAGIPIGMVVPLRGPTGAGPAWWAWQGAAGAAAVGALVWAWRAALLMA